MSNHRNFLEISVSALEHNLKAIKSMIAKDCQFMAIVKGNAWGAGTIGCARSFVHAGADWIGVTTVEDAALVRNEFDIPIMIICEPPKGQISEAAKLDIDITIYSIETARLVSQAAIDQGREVNVQIKINAGLNRVGVPPESAASFFNDVLLLGNLKVAGIFSHFSSADELSSNDGACREEAYEKTEKELGLFKQVLEEIKSQSDWIGMTHMANTGATIYLPESHLDMVRVSTGLMGLYDRYPFDGVIDFKQVFSWKTEVSHVIDVDKGQGVGYCFPYKCSVDTTIVTISLGWGDGLPRAFQNSGQVMIRGSHYHIVTMSMDMATIDLGERRDDISVGEEVVIFGEQQGRV